MDTDYISNCKIPQNYLKTIERGYYTKDQVIKFKSIWANSPEPTAWVPLEIYLEDMKVSKDALEAAVNKKSN